MKNYSTDAQMKEILENAKVIAVVGHSDKSYRTSYQIAQYLRRVGYKVYPVNPVVAEIDGEKSYASVADIPEKVDIVDVFRRSEFLDGVVDDTIAAQADTVWSQLGVYDEGAGDKALEAGVNVVQDRCIKIEHQRLIR
jgi:predicted CoA-binding protein